MSDLGRPLETGAGIAVSAEVAPVVTEIGGTRSPTEASRSVTIMKSRLRRLRGIDHSIAPGACAPFSKSGSVLDPSTRNACSLADDAMSVPATIAAPSPSESAPNLSRTTRRLPEKDPHLAIYASSDYRHRRVSGVIDCGPLCFRFDSRTVPAGGKRNCAARIQRPDSRSMGRINRSGDDGGATHPPAKGEITPLRTWGNHW